MKLLLAAFVDVSPEETEEQSPFESSLKDVTETSSSKDAHAGQEVSCYLPEYVYVSSCSYADKLANDMKVSQNGAAFKQFIGSSQESQSTGK